MVRGRSVLSLAADVLTTDVDDVEALIEAGNQLMSEGQHRRALRNFQQAYAVVSRLIARRVPPWALEVPPPLADATKQLLAAGIEAARRGLRSGWDEALLVSPIPPPEEWNELLERVDPRIKGPEDVKTVHVLDVAAAHAAAGEIDLALESVDRAIDEGVSGDMAARLKLAQATLVGAAGDSERALTLLEEAAPMLDRSGLAAEASVAAANVEALHSFARPSDEGAAVTRRVPLVEGAVRRAERFERPGAVTATRAAELTFAGAEVVALPIEPAAEVVERASMFVKHAGTRVQIDLADDAATKIEELIYDQRVDIEGLDDLRVFDGDQDSFTAALPHLFHFVLPMAIGECHLELGKFEEAAQWFERAGRYTYINTVVEVPLVWEMLAKTAVAWGGALLTAGDREGARTRYERVAVDGPDPVDPASPLYRSPTFDQMAAEARAVVSGTGTARPTIALHVRLALLNLMAIESGADLPLLSASREQVPVFRYEYLQGVARYMADQAIRAETSFIQFKSAAENELAQRRMLEDAAALAEANVELEGKMLDVAQAQRDAAAAQRDYVTEQRENAQASRSGYAAMSWELKELDALGAWIGRIGSTDNVRVTEGWGSYGIGTGTRRAADVAFDIARRRGEITREYELDQLQRQIDNLRAAEAAANANVAAAVAHEEAAEARVEVAELRAQQASDQLAAFEGETFTPEVWDRLASEVREIAREYLARAVVVARLLEEVLEFEIGEQVNLIRSDYLSDPVAGMIAGQRLLSDIDGLEMARIATLRKHHPMKEVVSLAERFPFRFATELRRTGRMEFTIDPSDLDWSHPGAYQHKIKRVELVVEGLVGPRGIRGTLTNTGFAFTRRRDGRLQLRLLTPETMPLSEYRIAEDAIVFPPGGRELAAFELAPVATTWRVEIPPRANELDLELINDVKLVVWYEALYDDTLRDAVILELLDTLPSRYQVSFDLGFDFPDGFFAFRDTGEIAVDLVQSHIPFSHENPEVERMAVFLATEAGHSPDGLAVRLTSPGGTSVDATTANGGLIATTAGGPLDALTGEALLGGWTVAIPEDLNQARFDAGFTWADVHHVLLSVDYAYQRRAYPGDPRLVLHDDFAGDSLASYERVDDARATEATPGEWTYEAAGERLLQRSGIFGPTGAAGDSPDKPGTYLLRRTADATPVLRDLLVSATLTNPGNGAMGLVFRYVDADNFYFFAVDAANGFRRIGKKTGGVFQELATPAADLGAGFTAGATYRLKVVARGNDLRAYVDGDLVVSGRDTSIGGPGRYGLYSWRSQNLAIDDFGVFAL